MKPTTQHRSRTRLEPAVRRRQIAEAAARIFADRDPGDVSFEAVAEEAGVSRSLVYSYFGDRGSLFAAAYSHELERLDTELGGALDALGSDRDRLSAAVRVYLHFAWDHRASWLLIASASASRHPEVRQAIKERVERIARSIDDSEDARLLVRSVIGMLEAAALHTMENESRGVEELADLLTTVIWEGVTSPGIIDPLGAP